jgi:hypothetical protein
LYENAEQVHERDELDHFHWMNNCKSYYNPYEKHEVADIQKKKEDQDEKREKEKEKT